MEDGEEISKKYHRHVLSPCDDISNEDERVIAVANAVWTEEVIANYRASIEPIE
ncbi:hypothetical protein [Sporomusa aerivorans]|uniref:hypothetical protein n=1 Tax=Sporomusa aerivorans TaxID=204936 RepID=UPI003529FBF6